IFFNKRQDVADDAELFLDPAFVIGRLIGLKRVAAAPGGDRGESCLGGHHARFHRCMRSLDARHVQKASAIPNQRAARECELWYRLITAVADRARSIGNTLAALQYLRDLGMRLPLLHFLERRGVRVAIVEPGDKAQSDLAIGLVIEEAATIGVG